MFAILIPFFIYNYFYKGQLNESFIKYANSSDYLTFLVLGTSFHLLSKGTLMNVGRALVTELREGTIESFLISPVSRLGYLIGCFLEQFGRAILEFVVILLMGVLLGARLNSIFTINSIIVIMLSIASFFTMSLSLSSFMLYTRDTYITQNSLFIFLSLVCGIAFPIQYLPEWLQLFSHLFPLTAALELFRSVVMHNHSILMHMDLVVEIVMLSAVYFVIGIVWHKKIEKKLLSEIFG